MASKIGRNAVEVELFVTLNRALRRIFGPKRDEVTGEWRNFITRSSMICASHPLLCG
jgi:hypothetical protein